MTLAFHGDPALREVLRERIERHATSGTLRIGQTAWENGTGSPIGVSIEGADVESYAETYGFPLPLAGLLDPLAAAIGPGDAAIGFVRGWVDCTVPGADLAPVPHALMLDMLDTPELDGVPTPLLQTLRALHRREADGDAPLRGEWRELRTGIATSLTALKGQIAYQAMLFCDAACWPAGRGFSPLATSMTEWIHLAVCEPDEDWGEAERTRRSAVLAEIAIAVQPDIDAGLPVDFYTLFESREPDLAHRSIAYSKRLQARTTARAERLADRCLALLAAAAPATELLTQPVA